jgi:two-component system, chemotaxis family, protein-glutamate methylesterase/glutaminase
MTLNPIKVLIVEDSPIAAKFLEFIINSDPDLKVMAWVKSGEEALEFIKGQKPDVITMDIVLPKMDGFETTQRIMQTTPIPIIIVSAHFQNEDIHKSFQAISVGALEILEKPVGPRDPAFKAMAEALIKSIKNAAKIKLILRRSYSTIKPLKEKIDVEKLTIPKATLAIAIGASLGGPKALSTIFSQLPPNFSIPIFVVQHISIGFAQGFVDWLNSITALKIKLAKNKEIIEPGCVYIAPDNSHLEVGVQTIHLNDAPPEDGLKPSVGRLFHSMANSFGPHGIGIILTGMGHDGARDLLLMKNRGALTIAQDQESSLLFGMPKEAISIGAVNYVLSLQQIADFLKLLAK